MCIYPHIFTVIIHVHLNYTTYNNKSHNPKNVSALFIFITMQYVERVATVPCFIVHCSGSTGY